VLLQLQKRRGLWKATSVLGRATAQWPISLEVAVDGYIGMRRHPVKGEHAIALLSPIHIAKQHATYCFSILSIDNKSNRPY